MFFFVSLLKLKKVLPAADMLIFLASSKEKSAMRNKFILCFVFCFSILAFAFSFSAEINSQTILNALINSLQKNTSPHYSFNKQEIIATIEKFDKLNASKIEVPDSTEFELLRLKADQIAILFDDLINKFEFEKENYHLIIALSEIYFQILNKLQSRMRDAFDNFEWQDRIRNMLPFVQSQNAYNYAKANILVFMAAPIFQLDNHTDKKRGWLAIDKMLDGIDFDKFKLNKTMYLKYLIVTMSRLIQLIEMLESAYESEHDSAIKSLASKPMQKLLGNRNQLKIQLEVAKEQQKWVAEQSAGYWFEKGDTAKDNNLKILYYTKAIQLNPQCAPAYNNRGNVYRELGIYHKAILDYTKTVQLDPQNALAYHNRGNIYHKIGRYEDAIQDYDKTIQHKSRYAPAYTQRGNAYRNLGKYEEAIRDYNKAIELDPQSASAYNNRGMSYKKLGQYAAAIRDHLKAIEISPNYAAAYYNLGCVYWALRDWNAVIEAWEKCLELNPEHENALEWLPKAKKEAGQDK